MNGEKTTQYSPYNHKLAVCHFYQATPELIEQAISGALQAKEAWENMPWEERCAIFLKAADLLSSKYRYQIMAATIIGQGKF